MGRLYFTMNVYQQNIFFRGPANSFLVLWRFETSLLSVIIQSKVITHGIRAGKHLRLRPSHCMITIRVMVCFSAFAVHVENFSFYSCFPSSWTDTIDDSFQPSFKRHCGITNWRWFHDHFSCRVLWVCDQRNVSCRLVFRSCSWCPS